MRNICKKLLFCGALALSAGAFAGSIVDGVHQCTLSVAGFANLTNYYVVVTNPGGQTGIAPVNLQSGTTDTGYSVGTVSGTTFTGQSATGKPWLLTINPTTLAMTGTGYNGNGFLSSITCAKIW